MKFFQFIAFATVAVAGLSARAAPDAAAELGLLRRVRAKDDERQVIVSLTARGVELKRRAAAVPDGMFCATECTPAELTSIRDHLLLLRARLLKNA